MSEIKRLEEQIEEAKKRLAESRAAFTPEMRESARLRRERAQIEQEQKDEDRARIRENLECRLDQAKADLGDESCVEGLMIKTFPDTFIVRRNGKAHAAWLDATARSHANGGKRQDRTEMHKKYAMAVVYDWNGVRYDDDVHPESTRKLSKFLEENPGVVQAITDMAVRLAGVFAEEQSKSD